MRTQIVILSVMLLSLSCKSSVKSIERTETTIEELVANPTPFVDKVVLVSGTVSHVCRHGGQKMFLFGQDPDKIIQLNTGKEGTEFDINLEGTEVRVEGILKELRIDEAYISALEKKNIQQDSLNISGESDSLSIHRHEQLMQNAAHLREQVNASRKGYISEYWLENIEVTKTN